MAQPPETLVFHNLTEAETLRAGRNIHQVRFQLGAQTPLNRAKEIDTCTFPGVDGFPFPNKELLDCKKRAKCALRHEYDRMRATCLEACDVEIRDLDFRIIILKQLIAIPNNMLPHAGPPLNQRNQGAQHVLRLPPLYNMPNVPYEMGPNLPFQPPLQDFADIVAARFLDEFSQKAWWEFNLECLEERKKIAEEKKVSLERRLEAIMKKALDSPSHLGAGYNFYNFVI